MSGLLCQIVKQQEHARRQVGTNPQGLVLAQYSYKKDCSLDQAVIRLNKRLSKAFPRKRHLYTVHYDGTIDRIVITYKDDLFRNCKKIPTTSGRFLVRYVSA